MEEREILAINDCNGDFPCFDSECDDEEAEFEVVLAYEDDDRTFYTYFCREDMVEFSKKHDRAKTFGDDAFDYS